MRRKAVILGYRVRPDQNRLDSWKMDGSIPLVCRGWTKFAVVREREDSSHTGIRDGAAHVFLKKKKRILFIPCGCNIMPVSGGEGIVGCRCVHICI